MIESNSNRLSIPKNRVIYAEIMFLSAFVWKINPFSGEIAVFQVKLAAILKMADPPIVTDTFCPNKPDFLFIDIKWPPKPLVFYTKVEKVSHSGNPNNRMLDLFI